MFRSYIDESEEGGVLAVGGFVGREDAWLDLEPKWLAQFPPEVEFFHATDCFTGNKQFKGMPISQRVELLDRLSDLVVEAKVYLVAGVIDVPAYLRYSPKALVNEFLENKWAAPFGAAVDCSCQSMNVPGEPFPHDVGDVCEFYVEKSIYSSSAARTLIGIRNDSIIWWRKRVGNPVFGRKLGEGAIPLLQVADFGVFLAAKKLSNAPDGRIPWTPYYEKLLKGNRIFRIVHVDEKSLDKLHYLHQDLKREAAEGKHYWDDI